MKKLNMQSLKTKSLHHSHTLPRKPFGFCRFKIDFRIAKTFARQGFQPNNSVEQNQCHLLEVYQMPRLFFDGVGCGDTGTITVFLVAF